MIAIYMSSRDLPVAQFVASRLSGGMLCNLSPDDPLHASPSEIDKAGERAAVLTRQLLAFSRKQVLLLRRLDLNRVVEGMRPMPERLAGADVQLCVVLDAESANRARGLLDHAGSGRQRGRHG